MRALIAIVAALAGLAAWAAPVAAQGGDRPVPSIELEGALTPAASAWVGHALEEADSEGAELAILRLDSAGGLASAAREIVDHVRTAPLPVVVFVEPGGAEASGRSASIVDAGDVAAMAPGTTLDSDGNYLGENTALKQGRIEMIAADQEVLLGKLDGFPVGGPKSVKLSTAGAGIDEREPTLPFRLLAAVVDPDITYLLLLIGILGLALEAFMPGAVVPGAIGAVALVIGVIAATQLPVAAIGVVLLAAGMALLLAEARLARGGVLGAGGVLALIAGGLVVFDTDTGLVAVSPAFVIGAGAILGGATVLAGVRADPGRRSGGLPVPGRDRV
ncbi:MAG TPA: hypothetical protein VFH44_05270 [Solirubrobacterales bacterium]|nr:hypothetical protein [Solirubrobacterales bacterium]